MELLVSLAIIALLIALLIPAVQMARESARRASCANNLKQLGLAIHQHENMHGFLPTGGWGESWIGDPIAGFGHKQPGGWVYNTLPFIDQKDLRSIGAAGNQAQKRAAMSQLLSTPIALFHCPSRRAADPYPYTGPTALKNADPPPLVAKSDYAVNPMISSTRSEIIVAEIKEGMSNIVMVGEKSVVPEAYDSGLSDGDKLTMYVGDCTDVRRRVAPPKSDREGGDTGFGSAHSEVCQFVYGDASVHPIAFGSPPHDVFGTNESPPAE